MPKNILLAVLAGLVVLMSTTFCSLTTRPALQFMPDKMPDATIGYPYNVEILVARNATPVGNYSISTGTLPPGLELSMDENLHTARITGTPSLEGTYEFTVSVWCYGTNVSGQTGEKKYAIIVAGK